jgi:hypothetical protein
MSDRNIKSANTPVFYKTTLDESNFTKAKLEQTFDDGSRKKVTLPVFTGDGGKTGNTEALIHCLDQYIRHTSKDLQWEDQDRFDNLEDVLTGEAFAYWTEEVVPRYENTPVPRFDPAIALLIQRFSGGDRGRDHLIRYLQSVNVRKDIENTVQEHFGRLIHMMNISDRLSGIEFPALTPVQRKKVLIESLPHQWRVNFNNAGLDYVTMTTLEIENYFTLQKEQADKDHKNKKKNNQSKSEAQQKGKRKHGGFSKGKGSPSSDDKNPEITNKCRKHPKGRHNWEDCYQNPKNKRAKQNDSRRGGNKQSNSNQHESNVQEQQHIPTPAERNDHNDSVEGRPTSTAQDAFLFQHPMDKVWEAHSGALKPRRY